MKRPLSFIIFLFIIGEAISIYKNWTALYFIVVILLCLMIAISLKFFRFRMGLVIAVLLFIGFFRAESEKQKYLLLPKEKERIMFTAHIEKIEEQDTRQTWSLHRVSFMDHHKPFSLNLLAYLDKEILEKLHRETFSVPLGTKVKIIGKIKHFPSATNPGEFDIKKYYQTQRIPYACEVEQIELVNKSTFLYWEKLSQIKKSLVRQLEKMLSGETLAWYKAVLFADNQEIKEDTWLYQSAGLFHLLVVSGQHISLLSSAFSALFKKLGLSAKQNTLFSFLLIFHYGLMIGMGFSIRRALIMTAIRICAKYLHRSYDPITALSITVALFLLWNPFFIGNSGLHYTVAALIAIYAVLPSWKEYFSREKLSIPLNFFSILVVQYVTYPLVLSDQGRFLLVSFLFNFCILPFFPFIFVFGFLAIFISYFSLMIGSVFAHSLSYFFLFCRSCIYFVIQYKELFVYRTEESNFYLILYYLLLFYLYLVPNFFQLFYFILKNIYSNFRKINYRLLRFYQIFLIFIKNILTTNKKRNKSLLKHYVFFFLPFAFIILFSKLSSHTLSIYFLDVGQGDCSLIQTPTGKKYLIDLGSSNKKSVGKFIFLPFLESKGIFRLDYVILTHPDSDHINGVKDLLDMPESRIEISHFILSKQFITDKEGEELVYWIKKRNIPIILMSQGDVLEDEEVKFSCLWPRIKEKSELSKDNNYFSLVFRVEYKKFSAIFTGDLEEEGEKELIQQGIFSCMLLKIGHHGSKSSTTQEWLETLQPKIAIISAGRNNPYGHPNPIILERLTQYPCIVKQTPVSGAIELKTNGIKVALKTFIQ
ncbi:ComE operon protein 3 [Clostridia bacterium]|nr:ComE operon protein 3 [Clostridia bacterium]